ncbi:MAG: hypothetical protein WB555_08760, partial [Candidatus Korobacteraceae bacterium]
STDVAPIPPPRASAFGALINYICHADAKHFQPANITFDLLQPLDEETRRRIRDKKQRHALVCKRALEELERWLVMALRKAEDKGVRTTFSVGDVRPVT